MKVRLLGIAALLCAVWGSGCGGGSLTITLSPATAQTLNPGQTLTVTAAVANDTNSEGVTWTLSGPGALSGNTTTTVVYTAPNPIPNSTTATITATSVANSSITATLSITLNAVFSIITTTMPSGTINVPYNSFVNSEGGTGTYTWNIVSGSLPSGLTLQPSTNSSAVISGTPTVLGTSSFIIEATDSADSVTKQQLSITIDKPPTVQVTTTSLPTGTVGVAYGASLAASGGTQPYTWSLIAGTLPVGLSLSSNGAIAGTPAVSGTFPFTVQVKDSSVPTNEVATANLEITINPGSTNNLKLVGNYAFSVRGFDPSGLFVAAGSFYADGYGNITQGLMDLNDPSSVQLSQTFTGTYSISTDGLGSMTFNLTSGGSRTFAVAVTVEGNASMIEFDDSNGTGTRDSGVLLKQTTPFSDASVSGGYAFGFLGVDSGNNRYGVVGQAQADGNGNFTSGALDSDDSSTGTQSDVSLTGSYSVATSGRGTATITAGGTSVNYSFYIVNGSELLVMDIDPFVSGGSPLVSGTMLKQSTPGAFSDSSLNGTGVFQTTALPSPSTSQVQVGLFNTAGSGSSTLSSDLNTGGMLSTGAANGTYSVSSNGRTTLFNSGFPGPSPCAGTAGRAGCPTGPIMYLISQNASFIIGDDAAVTFGIMENQSGEPFSNNALSGSYFGGSFAPDESSVDNIVSIAAVGSSSITFTTDISNTNGLSQVQATEDIANFNTDGRVVLTENGNTSAILYLVAPGSFFSLSTDTNARVDAFQQ